MAPCPPVRVPGTEVCCLTDCESSRPSDVPAKSDAPWTVLPAAVGLLLATAR
ncbi:hypothetical protein, conserved in T. vivax [Trypanosoma vivax Y486]|uniref:Uncharacterized protein n=1 Tax=Trypanosoma vivax (strain Y486) TaxID=1055687 RepID=F9WTM7_TRYVY|nr:hypothetical protein, conserved in T. vivax [Trypanosoma vivax Y486]|eukprot:CCD20921.1 hypothetical protein, conserved in T. vivax [Trypanosoma vivax Y486]